jgi:hypothetical protein
LMPESVSDDVAETLNPSCSQVFLTGSV